MSLKVGETEIWEWVWRDEDGSPITSGSASIKVRRNVGGSVDYLQGDLVSWGADNAIALSQVGDGFRLVWPIPSSAKGTWITLVAAHSDATLAPFEDQVHVTDRDADDLDAVITSRPTAAQVNAEVDTALADYDGPTRAEATADKDEVKGHVTTEHGTTRTHVTTKVDEVLTELGHSTYGLAALKALIDGISGGGGSIDYNLVAAAVWNALTASYVAPGSFGELAQASAGAAILVRKMMTNELQVKDVGGDRYLLIWDDGADPGTDTPIVSQKLLQADLATPATDTSGVYRRLESAP